MFKLNEQPQSIMDILSSGFFLYKESFKNIFVWSLIVNAIAYSMKFAYLPQLQVNHHPHLSGPLLLFMLLQLFVISPFFYTIIYYYLNNIAINQPLIGTSYITAIKNFYWRTISATLIYTIGTLLIIAVLTLPFIALFHFVPGIQSYAIYVTILMGIILAIMGFALIFSCLFTYPFIIAKGLGPVLSIKASFKLSWGKWWRIGLTILLPIVFSFGVATITNLIFDARPTVTTELIQILIQTLVSPYPFACILVLFYDLKLRKGQQF